MQLSHPVEPFGEVNVNKQKNGDFEIVATILSVPDYERARAGLAIDASASMKKMYGLSGLVGSPFVQMGTLPNVVEPVTRTMANYLANFSSTGQVDVIYWACSPDGSQIEQIGQFDAEEALEMPVTGPRKLAWGRGTKLLPPLRYFIEQAFQDVPWAICIFVTDGIVEDLTEVKNYSKQFAQQIASGQRAFIKLVLIGVGDQIDEAQMEELDDMFEGSGLVGPDGNPIDLWDHKLAAVMQHVEEIFAEVVSADVIVFGSGRITDQQGRVVKNYSDGVPSLLRFIVPGGTTMFNLELPGGTIKQDISEAFRTS